MQAAPLNLPPDETLRELWMEMVATRGHGRLVVEFVDGCPVDIWRTYNAYHRDLQSGSKLDDNQLE